MTTDAADRIAAPAALDSPDTPSSQRVTRRSGKPARNVDPMQAARRLTLDLDLYAKHLPILRDVLQRLGYDITLQQARPGARHPEELYRELEDRRLHKRAAGALSRRSLDQ
jgi:hypothetical protein